MPTSYPWYAAIEAGAPLEQGELVENCPILKPPPDIKPGQTRELAADIYDVVIMSQSCDLQSGKVSLVLVCPYFTWTDFKEKSPLKGTDLKKRLTQGSLPGFHLLEKCTTGGRETDYLVVDFKSVYGVHIDAMTALVSGSQRVELLPPYKEHLSQAFARFFMRVGLPSAIPHTALP